MPLDVRRPTSQADALDPDWSDKTLIGLFDNGVPVEAEFQVASGLEARASQDLQAALNVAQAFVRSRGESWRVSSIRQELRQVITEGLQSADPLKAQARRIVDELVAKGHLEFKELLEDG